MKEDPSLVSARLSSDQFPVPAPRSGGVYIMNGLGSKPNNGNNMNKFALIASESKENRPFGQTDQAFEDDLTEDFEDEVGDGGADDDEDDIPEEWKDDGEIHLVKRCQPAAQTDFVHYDGDEAADANEQDYGNGGLWNEVIEEVEEEEEDEPAGNGNGDDRDSNVGYFEEFDLEAVERSIREKSRNFRLEKTSAAATAATPTTFFDDDGDADGFDLKRDRQSWQLRPSVSVKNIAKLFETQRIAESSDAKTKTRQSEFSGLKKSSWKSMPNLGNDDPSDDDVNVEDQLHQRQVSNGAAIPKAEYEVCSKVPIKDRRSIFEKISAISKSWSIQNLHQTSKSSQKVNSATNGAKKPLPLVGTNLPSPREIGVRDPPPVKGILKNFESRNGDMKPTQQKQKSSASVDGKKPATASGPDVKPTMTSSALNGSQKSLASNDKTIKTIEPPVVAYRWEDESNGEIYTDRLSQKDDAADVDDIDNPLYVVENGREYRLMTLKQRRQVFEAENVEKSTTKSRLIDKMSNIEKKIFKQNGELKKKVKENQREEKVLESPESKNETTEEASDHTTVKSLNVPYIVEEQEVLRSINIVKSVKTLFSKQSNATKSK